MRFWIIAAAFGLTLAPIVPAAAAEQAVSVGGGTAVLDRPARPIASIILVPGGDGRLGITPDGQITQLRGNQLVRTRGGYARAGFATLTIDASVGLAQAVEYMRAIAGPVTIVATSRGSLRVAGALGARPDGIVLTASFLDQVQASIGSSASAPPILVVHHRKDGCRLTSPTNVEPFQRWGAGRVRVVWLDGGRDEGDPCQAGGHHGFAGLDGRVVGAVAAFARRPR